MKRVSLVLAAGVAAVAISCGGSGSTDAGSAASSTAAPSTTAATSTSEPSGFTLASTSFKDNQPIPKRFTCEGDNVSPELHWSGVPDGTNSLALTVVDPDAPVENGFVHWVLVGIDPSSTTLSEGAWSGTLGMNGAGRPGYTGPCPPTGKHRYVFTLYAMSKPVPLNDTVTREKVEATAADAVGKTTLTGTYQKQG